MFQSCFTLLVVLDDSCWSGCGSSCATVCSVLSWLLTVVRPFLQVLVGALESSGDIVSVSCCDNEIFILKGDRDVIRLSDCPEGVTSDCEHRCWLPAGFLQHC